VRQLFPALDQASARPAITFAGTTLSYGELAAACTARMTAHERSGLKPGDRVAVVAKPALDTLIEMTALAWLGAVAVPINPALGARERAHVARDSAEGHLPGQDPLLILYTSGTTGPPKGAVITAANVASNLDALAQIWQWTAADTVVHALPLFHVHGLVLGLFGALRRGAHLHWLGRFEPAALGEALSSAPSPVLFAVPTMYHRLADAAAASPALARALRGARLRVSGSAALSARDHHRLRQVAGCQVHERYGLTETLIVCGVPCAAPARPGYVGLPLPGVELCLVDDQRAPLDAADEQTMGEIAVRGPGVFAGYLNRPDETAAVLDADGWFYTGDLATQCADGTVRIVGRRATDLIKTGGYKVGAAEIETCLAEDPAVAEVAVLGVDDEDLGQRIVAYVVPRDRASPPDPQRLIDRVAADLAPHKRPRTVHFVDRLPRNSLGKVQKRALLGAGELNNVTLER
jgi:malonyl-CoA/methylmalonyl-CoA synthetase